MGTGGTRSSGLPRPGKNNRQNGEANRTRCDRDQAAPSLRRRGRGAVCGHGHAGRLSERRRGDERIVLDRYGSDRGDQPVPALRDGLDDPRMLRIILEQTPQLGDRTGEHIIADRGVGPGGLEQPLLRHHLAGALRETQEHQHDLGFEACRAARARHAVERWLDVMGLADPYGVLQRPALMRRQRDDSTGAGVPRRRSESTRSRTRPRSADASGSM